MDFDSLGFEARYEVVTEVGIPPAGEPLWFPATGRRSADGLVIRVAPEVGPAWTGVFGGGGGSMSGVLGTPRAGSLLVVSRGDGCMVPADDPRAFERVPLPVVEVHAAHGHGLLLLVSWTGVLAYGEDGLRWTSKRIADDGVSITGIAGGRAEGRAWSSPRQEWAPFSLDLATGRHEGGVRE